MPVPVEVEEEKRCKQKPSARLRIERGEIDGEDAVVGFPTFTYGDSSALFATHEGDPAASHSEIRGNKRITWPRDPGSRAEISENAVEQRVRATNCRCPNGVSRKTDAPRDHPRGS